MKTIYSLASITLITYWLQAVKMKIKNDSHLSINSLLSPHQQRWIWTLLPQNETIAPNHCFRTTQNYSIRSEAQLHENNPTQDSSRPDPNHSTCKMHGLSHSHNNLLKNSILRLRRCNKSNNHLINYHRIVSSNWCNRQAWLLFKWVRHVDQATLILWKTNEHTCNSSNLSLTNKISKVTFNLNKSQSGHQSTYGNSIRCNHQYQFNNH